MCITYTRYDEHTCMHLFTRNAPRVMRAARGTPRSSPGSRPPAPAAREPWRREAEDATKQLSERNTTKELNTA